MDCCRLKYSIVGYVYCDVARKGDVATENFTIDREDIKDVITRQEKNQRKKVDKYVSLIYKPSLSCHYMYFIT